MKFIPFIPVFILLILPLLQGESLWDPGFRGYISSQAQIAPGDVLIVVIDAAISLSHVSTQKDSKTITFEYTGGEYGDLFSFLPSITTGIDNNVKGDEKVSLKSEMVVRVVSLQDEEHGYIEGSREITIDSKKETITLTGYINGKDVNPHGQISFSKVADARLVYQTFLYPQDDVLTKEDIEEIVKELAPVTTEGTTPVEVTPTETVTETPVTDTAVTEGTPADRTVQQTRLTKEKKLELFLNYVNRMIDLLFQ